MANPCPKNSALRKKRFTRKEIRDFNKRCNKRAMAKGSIPTWIRGQLEGEPPMQFLSLEECKELKSKGFGSFINRSQGFRRFDISKETADLKDYKPTGRRGQSLAITEDVIHAYVDGSSVAEAAVNIWA